MTSPKRSFRSSKKNCIEGVKSKDFQDFCKVADLMAKKAHLTPEGLAKIRALRLRAGMNIS